MKKHLVLTSLAAIIATTGIAAAATTEATDVAFNGDYTNASNHVVNVSHAVANEQYKYTKSDGYERTVLSQDTPPTLSDFTYTDKDGITTLDLSSGTKTQAYFAGTSVASGDVSYNGTGIVSGATVSRSDYSYKNGKGDIVTLGEAAQSFQETHELSNYAGSGTITVTDGVADGSVSVGDYKGTAAGTEYSLNKDTSGYYLTYNGGLTIRIEDTTGDVETLANNLKNAYEGDEGAVADLITNTDTWATAEATKFGDADLVFNTDKNAVIDLDTSWNSYQTAAGLLTQAQGKQQAAQTAKTNNDNALIAANALYTASITTTIDDAISESVENGSVKTALAAKADANNVYTKAEANSTFLTTHQDISGKADKSVVNEALGLKADASAVELALNGKADKATTLAGYGITDAYTSGQVNDLISDEATARSNADQQLANQINDVADELRGAFAAADAHTLSNARSYTDAKVNELEKNVSGGVAAATALSAVAVSNVDRGEVSVGGGYGYYNGQSAVAFGATMGLSDSWSVNAGAGLAQGDKTQFSIRAGTNYKFKLF